MPGPTVGELMSDHTPGHEDEDDDDEEEEEEEDDFVPRRRRESSADEQQDSPSAKRERYSPSGPNGYSRASPPAPPLTHSSHSQPPQPHTSTPALHAPRPPGMKPPLEHSILNVEPLDELIREVADFVHRHVVNRSEHVEVEAKIGVMRDAGSGQRIRLPIGVETTLSSDMGGIRFESNMSASQHRHYNTLLNNLGSEPVPPEGPRTPLKYHHTHLVDSFYPAPDGSRDKVRVTIDEGTGKVVQCVRKVRLGDLNIYSPKRNADWRVSVNLEVPMPQPAGSPTHTRKKDRMTYTHQYCNIDLTQVRQSATLNSAPTVLHELEVEFNPSAVPVLLHSSSHRNSPDPSVSQEQRDEFDEIIRIFVNNARILVRNASTAWEGS